MNYRRSIAKAISELQIADLSKPEYAESVLMAAAKHVHDALNEARRINTVGNRRASDADHGQHTVITGREW